MMSHRNLVANALQNARAKATRERLETEGRALADALRAVVHTAESDSAHAAVQTAVR